MDHLTKVFGELVAVDDLTMEIPDRSIVAFLGPSGCGKTTTMRMISGLETPTKGDVYIGDLNVTTPFSTPKDRDVGMVFQFAVAYDSMSVYDNIAIPLRVRKVPKSEIRKRVMEVAELLKLTPYLKRRPGEFDVSVRQRTAIARTIVKERKVYLLDEPLTNLPVMDRIELRSELKKLRDVVGGTMIYVTHDQSEAMTIADKIMVMHLGKLQQYDYPKNIYNKPGSKFVAWFIGEPGMNLIECSFMEKRGKTFLDAGDFLYEIPKDIADILRDQPTTELILGIRGEHIEISDAKKGNNWIEASLKTAEHWGNMILAHLQLGESVLIARTPKATFSLQASEKTWVYFPPEKVSIFERKSEKTIL